MAVFVADLAGNLTKDIGHQVKIKKISTEWQWLNLKVSINELLVLDKDTSAPLLMINKVVSTVDALQSIFNLEVKFKNVLLQNPKLILQLDHKYGPMIMGLYGPNNLGQIDSTTIFKALNVQSRISIEDGDIHIQGIGAADLPLMHVKFDFIKKNNLEYSMVLRGAVAAATPPEFVFAMKYHGKLEDYAKAMMEFDFKSSNLQVDDILQMFPVLKNNFIHGDFKTLEIKGVIQHGELRYIQNEFSIANLNIGENIFITNGEGHVEFKPAKDKLNLSIANLHVVSKNAYSQPLKLDLIRGELVAKFVNNNLDLFTDNLIVKLLGMEFTPRLQVSMQDTKLNNLSVESKFRSAHVSKVLKLIPDLQLSNELLTWLRTSVLDGVVDNTKLLYQNHQLYWKTDIKKAELKFSPDWPSVTGINASIILDHEKLQITATEASILGNKLNSLTADFSPLKSKKFNKIAINGDINTTLSVGIDYLQHTPLNADITQKLATYNPKGNMNLSLGLDIKVDDVVDVLALGTINLKQASINFPEIKLPLLNLSGTINFTNTTISANDLDLELFGKPAKAKISLSEDKNIGLQLELASLLEIATLEKNYPALNLDKLNGMTEITAKLSLPSGTNKQDKTLTIDTNLQGISIDYPAPFNKDHASKLPLQLSYVFPDKTDARINFKLDKLLQANVLLRNDKVAGGHISLGGTNNVPATYGSVLVSGRLGDFNWDDWQPLLKLKNNEKHLPIQVELLFDSLIYNHNKYKAMLIKYDSQRNDLFLDGPIIKGIIHSSNEHDKIDIKLDMLSLDLTELKNNSALDYVREKNKNKQLPLVQFYCEKMKINKKEFNKVSAQLLPRVYGYEINDFSIANDNILLQAQGQWQIDNKESTQLSGSAYTKNFGKLLSDWGHGYSITKGTGEMNFSIRWNGDPTKFSLMNLHGSSHIELQSGNITGVTPGLGRVIGLLNVDSIQRRLKLDFSDIYGKGFSFDKLVSDLKLAQGIIASENIVINSPAARIDLTGKANLQLQDLDFIMLVTPKVGMGLPVAAAIAVGNPAIGAAIWLFDKASGSKISEISRYKYKVTGTWDAPKIEEMEAKKTGTMPTK